MGSGVAGQACITDDLAAVIDSRGVAEGTAQGFEIPHDAVTVDKGVTNGVANEVGNGLKWLTAVQ